MSGITLLPKSERAICHNLQQELPRSSRGTILCMIASIRSRYLREIHVLRFTGYPEEYLNGESVNCKLTMFIMGHNFPNVRQVVWQADPHWYSSFGRSQLSGSATAQSKDTSKDTSRQTLCNKSLCKIKWSFSKDRLYIYIFIALDELDFFYLISCLSCIGEWFKKMTKNKIWMSLSSETSHAREDDNRVKSYVNRYWLRILCNVQAS